MSGDTVQDKINAAELKRSRYTEKQGIFKSSSRNLDDSAVLGIFVFILQVASIVLFGLACWNFFLIFTGVGTFLNWVFAILAVYGFRWIKI